MTDRTNYELIILGAGPGGMTAGVYAARKQLDMLIISPDIGGQTTWSSQIENYPGFMYVTGAELVAKFEQHLNKFHIRMEFTKAAKLYRLEGGFGVDTIDGRTFRARSVVVATGKSPKLLNVPGEKELTGRGVTYCATCDGPVFAGMEVAVVGGGNSGLEAVVQLMKICPKVHLIEMTDRLRADEIMQEQARNAPNVEILIDTTVKHIHGETMVDGITVENQPTRQTRRLDVKGVFIEVGLVPSTEFLNGLLALNERGEIPVDCGARTCLPGLFAAGDVTDVPEKQIVIAAGDGAKAGLAAYSYLVRLPASPDWGSTRPWAE